MERPATLVMITGLPGAGKSTIAGTAADHLDAAVLGWDWMMGGLTGFDQIQDVLRGLDARTYADIGWSVLFNLAAEQLRRGRSVVLDGVARDRQIAAAQALVASEGGRLLVVLDRCPDETTHRSRIEGRQRRIPGWHELTWANVARSRADWQDPGTVDLELDTTRPLDELALELTSRLASR